MEDLQMHPYLRSHEAEKAALGSCLRSEAAMIEVEDALVVDDFDLRANRVIYEAMLRLRARGVSVDLVTVTVELGDDLPRVGGPKYLANLEGSFATTVNVDHYIAIVKEKTQLRQLFRAATEIAAGATEGKTPAEIVLETEKNLTAIEGGTKGGFRHIKDILLNTFERIEHRFSSAGGVIGVPSGFSDLDKMTSGFQEAQLIIVAARPAVGKTAFALNVAQNAAVRYRKKVGIVSLEMASEKLTERMLCAEANIDGSRMRSGMLDEDDWPKLTMAVGTLSEAGIFIDDEAGNTLQDIRSKIRKLKKQHDCDMIIIDYLQLIQTNRRHDNRQQEVAEISRSLKLLTKELGIPIIALSQISRAVETRQDKRPMMADLRESGAIEQDADIVIFLYRDEYYNPDSERKNIIELIIAKQRDGPTGTVELVYLKNFNKFLNLERAPGA